MELVSEVFKYFVNNVKVISEVTLLTTFVYLLLTMDTSKRPNARRNVFIAIPILMLIITTFAFLLYKSNILTT